MWGQVPEPASFSRFLRRNIFSARRGAVPGRLQGHTAIQIPQPWVSLKYGMHLSKSTYHFSTPRTSCLSLLIADAGHALMQTWQRVQNSFAPNSVASSATNGISVTTADNRNDEPYRRLIMLPCLPSSPNPQARAAGVAVIEPAQGPACDTD